MNTVQQSLISLISSRYQLPAGMTDPDQIISYLLQNGKITQQQYNQARVQAQSMQQNGGLPTPETVANYLFRR